MIAWLHPAALIGLLAAALPVVVHLLRRERARRVIVPSLRFLRAGERSAVRLRTLADPWLLLLRIAIVTCAALAAARPLLLTDARHAQWSERVARAVVVDTTASVREAIDPEQIASAAGTASPAVSIETMDLGRGIARAVSWLAAAPPARREIVILSDFQQGSISATDLASIPGEVGVRLVPVRAPSAASTPLLSILGQEGAIAARVGTLNDATAVSYGAASAIEGLEIVSAPEDAGRVERLMRIVGAAGAIAPSPEQPIAIRFDGGQPSSGHEPAPAWAIAAAARLLRAQEVQGVALGVSTNGGRLVVDVLHARPDSLEGALVVKAALDARLDPATFAESEPQRLPDATLAAWSRAPGPADVSTWQQSDQSDGRWLWALALVLLVAEAFARRATQPAVRAEEPHAA